MRVPFNDGTGRVRCTVRDLIVGDTLCGSGMHVLSADPVQGGQRAVLVRFKNGEHSRRCWRASTTVAVKPPASTLDPAALGR